MNRGAWLVAVVIMVVGAPGVSVSQTTRAGSDAKVQPPPAAAHTAAEGSTVPDVHNSCPKSLWAGRHIVSNLGIVEFRIPRFTVVTKPIDADFVVYGIR